MIKAEEFLLRCISTRPEFPGIPHPQPRPREGQTVGDFMVPAEHSHLSFVEACARLKVKTKGKAAALYSK